MSGRARVGVSLRSNCVLARLFGGSSGEGEVWTVANPEEFVSAIVELLAVEERFLLARFPCDPRPTEAFLFASPAFIEENPCLTELLRKGCFTEVRLNTPQEVPGLLREGLGAATHVVVVDSPHGRACAAVTRT